MNLDDKVAIITGSSKGIGKAIAERFCKQGAKVVISSRKQEACEEVAFDLKGKGYEATGIECHVGDDLQRQSLVEKTIQAYGKIDVLVNNAAINPVFGPIEDVEDVAFDKIINVNVKSVWSLSNLVLPHMIENNGGSIINVSSVEGLHPGFGLGLYSMSKAAVIMLTKNQAKEWGKHQVRCNVICPGLVKTKFSQALWSNEKILDHLEESIPSGRMAMPEEMTGLALLLASDDGSYMTGGVYTADGGYLVK
ncbi:SDR family NAD(P)-dependent oxidoreductase [Portibacter marinus]|uniref:SDR family NAD(P)-dependent oxidoreductase n=1 Tax=Portibacter marinus TaxID=2898660 RepID=UPI001F465D73|nr:glucose 1-dehydrogenase [Portibacter marinus]